MNGGYTAARFSGAAMVFPTNSALQGNTSATSVSGWFLGGGVETTFDMLGMLGKGWFWRNEYRYASYGSKTIADAPVGAGTLNSITFKPTVQTVTSSVIFKFN